MTGRVYTHEQISESQTLQCDVCIVGSGAGGGTLAAGLVARGLDVIMLESGQYQTRKNFDMDEAKAFRNLYHNRGLHTTKDLSISILQGHNVGGGTTINWTTCFRTPQKILQHWEAVHGVQGLSDQSLSPHFEAMEKRLGIQEWPEAAINANNQVIRDGARKLGWEYAPIRRNVRSCANSGYCGMGCPVDAKQSMLVTCIPDALKAGMRLYANTKARRLVLKGNKVEKVLADVMDPQTGQPSGKTLTILPKVTVSSCGAIHGPALFLRSDLNDNGRVGARTFFHPVVAMVTLFDKTIDGFYGAPQSISSHQFADRGEDEIGFFIEAAPTHPVLAATSANSFGAVRHDFMAQLHRLNFLIALHIDGLLPGDDGGTVSLQGDGRVAVDYPVRPALAKAFQAAHKELARLGLAAGAQKVQSLHAQPVVIRSEADIALLDQRQYGNQQHGIFTAHQMGGLAMGGDPSSSVVNSQLRHHRVENLFVVDGSVFPTSLGVNPSLTIYGLAHRAQEHVANAVG